MNSNVRFSNKTDKCDKTIALPSLRQFSHRFVLVDLQRKEDSLLPFHKPELQEPTNQQLCCIPYYFMKETFNWHEKMGDPTKNTYFTQNNFWSKVLGSSTQSPCPSFHSFGKPKVCDLNSLSSRQLYDMTLNLTTN